MFVKLHSKTQELKQNILRNVTESVIIGLKYQQTIYVFPC